MACFPIKTPKMTHFVSSEEQIKAAAILKEQFHTIDACTVTAAWQGRTVYKMSKIMINSHLKLWEPQVNLAVINSYQSYNKLEWDQNLLFLSQQ